MLSFSDDDAGYVRELAEFVAVPSVSRDASTDTMQAAARWVAGQLGFAGGRVVQTAGHPVVLGEWLEAPGAPTVLVYGHFDVQPTGDLAEWRTPPFELTVDGDIVRGRGATDDKGPVYIVLKTAQAFVEQEGGLPLNVKFLFEGEEEIGSPNLPAFLREHAGDLAADLVISADGAMWRPTEPSVALASKGLVSMDIRVEGASTDLHSGRFGGTVANPLHVLSEILASLHGSDGTVAVPGFYDGIPPLAAERREQIGAVAFSESDYLGDLGLAQPHGEAGYSTLERLWERPTLDVNGIAGGGKYTVIPHVAVGHVSCRLVPGQDPDAVIDAITAHVSRASTAGLRVTVLPDLARVPAYTIAADHPAIAAATAALEAVYPGQHVLQVHVPGTLPATVLFERELGAKTLFFSFSTADEKLHAPNEYLRLRRLREGMRAWEQLWRLLAAGTRTG
jgi:acetylornithine deacetylase/succinyl-diaminopimelate desuccinylase-like protein